MTEILKLPRETAQPGRIILLRCPAHTGGTECAPVGWDARETCQLVRLTLFFLSFEMCCKVPFIMTVRRLYTMV